MNKQILKLFNEAGFHQPEMERLDIEDKFEKFAELIVAKVLDEVATRAFVSGDRAWSDEVDRQWVELEFGYGSLADAQKGIFK